MVRGEVLFEVFPVHRANYIHVYNLMAGTPSENAAQHLFDSLIGSFPHSHGSFTIDILNKPTNFGFYNPFMAAI